MAKAVKVIPAKPVRMVDGLAQNAKKKACAYCRVSTDSKEQENSYESQIAYGRRIKETRRQQYLRAF